MQILLFALLLLALLLLAQLGVGVSTMSTLSERKLSHIICRDTPGYDHANKGRIEKGISYLRGHDPPQATLCHQPGGGCCSRLSCDTDAAIYACNDDEAADKVVSLSDVADLAQAVLDDDDCVWKPSTGHVVLGQAFDDGGWNVIVGIKDGDSC
ncbi:hypothetical protein INS49_012638 [Diaporthe citri]|uniref:uncharacterized protein n=1 Tax=Diaporthe citri TaxID=83186 RepID=UPI001C7EAE64|nr:uncharacterized protein INS49_012638 [Diaporthe citri]KAG6359118.1 hypothetical protein INS49_012638 [Diaporthe citri]